MKFKKLYVYFMDVKLILGIYFAGIVCTTIFLKLFTSDVSLSFSEILQIFIISTVSGFLDYHLFKNYENLTKKQIIFRTVIYDLVISGSLAFCTLTFDWFQSTALAILLSALFLIVVPAMVVGRKFRSDIDTEILNHALKNLKEKRSQNDENN